ncbi:MAG: Glycosyl transferase, group 1, partial [uncultured Solirubrobacteraceae bacterium]
GGLARHVGRLSDELAAQGHEVHVVTRAGPGPSGDAVREGVHVHRVPASRTPWDLDAFLAWIDELNAGLLAAGRALGGGFDVVHGHDWLVGRAADALARGLGVPLVMTFHATEHGRHEGRVAHHPQDRIHASERALARRADAVIACSRFMGAHVTEVFGLDPARVRVIANGIDAPAAAPRRAAREDGERLVLLVGRLVYEKGFQVALDALPAVLAAVPGARFVVAGSGPYEEELRAQAERLGLLDRGAFLGWTGDAALAELYAAADVCAVPSLFEPFGLVALEAMAAGCPVVAADTGGLREVVPDGTGLRVRPGDAGDLARALAEVLTDPGRAVTLAAAARAHAAGFGWGAAARRTAEVYAQVVAGAR